MPVISKRTKIVCTIGPASQATPILRKMIRAGMNVARLNFSHGTYASHTKTMKNVLAAAKAEHEPVTLLMDLQGPKIRLGVLPDEGVAMKPGQEVVLRTGTNAFTAGPVPAFPVTFANLHKDVKAGHRILIDDGLLEIKVTKVVGREIHAKVVNGGKVTSHKGMNLPDSTLHISPITAKDRQDLAFGVRSGVDWVALSFVTSAKDIRTLRGLIKRASKKGQTLPRIIAKIEKHEAITHFDDILEAVDGIMVARGDLGIEIPAEDVPIRQKEIIEKCRLAGKPVIVATQMMDSMTKNPRPTRAEVSDVANAVIDHTDAVMLSGESATGAHPVETVAFMAKIAARAEASQFDDVPLSQDLKGSEELLVSHALEDLVSQGFVDGILTATYLAPWSEQLNMSRPEAPIFIAAQTPCAVRQLNMRWGVKPFLLPAVSSKAFVAKALAQLKKAKMVKPKMRLALVLGGEHGTGFDLVEV